MNPQSKALSTFLFVFFNINLDSWLSYSMDYISLSWVIFDAQISHPTGGSSFKQASVTFHMDHFLIFLQGKTFQTNVHFPNFRPGTSYFLI